MGRLSRRYGVASIIVTAAVLATPSNGASQAYVSPYVGVMLFDGSLGLFQEGVRQGPGLETDGVDGVVGLGIGTKITDRWGAGLTYGRSSLRNADGDITSHVAYGTVEYSLRDSGRWLVKLNGGAGGITYRGAGEALVDPAIAAGLSAGYRMNSRIGIEARYQALAQLCGKSDPESRLQCNRGSNLGYSALTTGLWFQL